jgi:hypothetical protein
MNEAEIRIAHPRDWVELTPAFLRIMSFVDEGGARARVRALECINRDLPEKRLRAALVAPDNTIIKILEKPDFQGRTVRSPLDPAEGVWIEPPFEEGRVCICRASLDEWYSTHPATPTAVADRQLPAADESEPAARAEESMPELAETEHTRWQRDRTIEAMKTLLPPDGIRPKGMSIKGLTDRINKLEEFQENKVSEDTVRLADTEIKDPLKK